VTQRSAACYIKGSVTAKREQGLVLYTQYHTFCAVTLTNYSGMPHCIVFGRKTWWSPKTSVFATTLQAGRQAGSQSQSQSRPAKP